MPSDLIRHHSDMPGPAVYVVAVVGAVATGYVIKKVRRSRTLLPTLDAHYTPHPPHNH